MGKTEGLGGVKHGAGEAGDGFHGAGSLSDLPRRIGGKIDGVRERAGWVRQRAWAGVKHGAGEAGDGFHGTNTPHSRLPRA